MTHQSLSRMTAAFLTEEQRETVRVLVYLRWAILGAAVFVVDYEHGTSQGDWIALNGFIVAGAAMNALMHWQIRTGRRVPLMLPIGTSLYDAAAVTAAVALVDGFGNPSFLLFYPAVLAYSITFPGRFSLAYCLAVMLAYGIIAPPLHGKFDWHSTTDQKALVLRLTTVAAVAVAANLIVRVEQERRERAVANEAKRASEMRKLEQDRALERQRLLHDVHDGIAQSVYMIGLGLESVAHSVPPGAGEPGVRERLDALTALAKQTLLETRGLLFDLGQAKGGELGVTALTENLAREFEAITGIETATEIEGAEPELAPVTVSEVFRVIQGAIGNVQRHSDATHARIGLRFRADGVEIEVWDDGKGFNAAAEYGVGRRSMEARAARLGGRIETHSEPGAGTRVVLSVPLTAAGKEV